MVEELLNSAIFAEEASSLKGKNMLALVSGRRNSGKTWLSVNLAQALSSFKQKVILFDGDSGINNAKAQLGVNYVNDLDTVIYGTNTLNQAIHSYDKGRFDIIASRSGSVGITTMSIGRLQILGDDLSIIAQNYDKMILDISPGMCKSSKVLTGMSQNAFIVCTDAPQSITDNYELIKLIQSCFPKTNVQIIINQVNSIEEGLRTYKMLEKACNDFLGLKPPLLGIVRQDTRVRDSIRNQSTIISRYPQSEASIDIMSLAQRIIKNEQFN